MELQSDTKIFVDSNFFVASFGENDAHHQTTLAFAGRLFESYTLFISNFIFLETVSVLSQRFGRKIAILSGERLLSDSRIHIVHIDHELQIASWGIFQQIDKKNMSFVDCSIIAVMQAENIKSLLTFDRTDFAPLRQRYHFKFFE